MRMIESKLVEATTQKSENLGKWEKFLNEILFSKKLCKKAIINMRKISEIEKEVEH